MIAGPSFRRLHRLAALAAAAIAGGCLSVPVGPAPMCQSNNDCDRAHGEVCSEAVCWGNPPPGPFAAVISSPSTRRDLVSRELPGTAIPDSGWMGDLALEAPVLLSGRVVAFCAAPMVGCDSTTLGATVTVSRRSQFQGGPGFKAVVNVAAGAESFSIPVPRTRGGDDPYTVTVVPSTSAQSGSGRSPASQVPPLRLELPIPDNTGVKPVVLGGASLPIISGVLRDGFAQPLVGYRVAALGRWDPTEPAVEVSSVAASDTTGAYAVTLSDNLVGGVELVARPPDGVIAPILHMTNLDATHSAQRSVTQPDNLGSDARLDLQVMGADLSGTIAGVPGAVVSVAGVFSPLNTPSSQYTISDEQISNERGMVSLHLLDGAAIAGSYQLSIIPPASSPLGVMFAQPVSLAPGPPKRLSSRIALRGAIVDSNDKPLANVTVTARPSLRFLWTLEPAPQAFVAAIPAATAVTPDTGEFVVWVDANVTQVWGDYELVIEPPAAAQAPTYIKTDVVVPRNSQLSMIALGKITLPEAAFVHGRITGPDGEPVTGAELKLYLISTSLGLCSEVAHAPASCPIPAQLQSRNTSDSKGTVRLALPRWPQ